MNHILILEAWLCFYGKKILFMWLYKTRATENSFKILRCDKEI